MDIVELEIQSPGAGVFTSVEKVFQAPDGKWARVLDVRGSVQTDATVANRNLLLRVTPEDSFAVVAPTLPFVPATTNANSLWDAGQQSAVTIPFSSPGHVKGQITEAVFKGVVRFQLTLNNGQGTDQIGVHRVRLLTGDLSEFQL